MIVLKFLPSFVRQAIAAGIEAELSGISADQVVTFKAAVIAAIRKLLKV